MKLKFIYIQYNYNYIFFLYDKKMYYFFYKLD